MKMAFLGTALAASFAGSAMAFVPWTNASGTAAFFNWSNGGSDIGLFGSPLLVGGDTFVFFPSGFRAEAQNGGSTATYDRLQFEVEAHAGFVFSDIRVTEYGDYGVIGAGGQVSAGGTLFVTDLIGGGSYTDNIITNPGSPIFSGLGNWQGDAAVSLAPSSSTRLRVTLNNNLVAIAGANGIAYIEKKVFGSAVGITIVPTPGSMAMVMIGGLVATRRRR